MKHLITIPYAIFTLGLILHVIGVRMKQRSGMNVKPSFYIASCAFIAINCLLLWRLLHW